MVTKDEISASLATLAANSNNMKDDISEIKKSVNNIWGDMDELKVGNALLKQHLNEDKRNKKLAIGAISTAIIGLIIAGFTYIINLGSNA